MCYTILKDQHCFDDFFHMCMRKQKAVLEIVGAPL